MIYRVTIRREFVVDAIDEDMAVEAAKELEDHAVLEMCAATSINVEYADAFARRSEKQRPGVK